MAENRYRSTSPSRRYVDPRASTGMVFSSSYDPRYPQQPRTSVENYPTTRHASIYDTQPIKRRTYADGLNPGATISRTEYAVRPRHNSFIAGESRRPMSTLVRANSPPRTRPVVSNASRDQQRSPVRDPYSTRDDSNRYLVPASSQGRRNHYRHNSATPTDMERLSIAGGGSQSKGRYNQSGGYGQKAYSSNRGTIPDDGYSYTGPREQFARDMSSRPQERTGGYSRKERPVSVIDTGDYVALAPPRREPGAPTSSRLPERTSVVDASRLGIRHDYESDPDRRNDVPRRRHSTRAPVLHQSRNDEYPPTREEYDSRNPQRPRKDRIEEDDRTTKQRPRDYDKYDDRERSHAKDYERTQERDRERDRDRDRERDRDRDRARGHEKVERTADDRREGGSRHNSPERLGLGKGVATAALGGIAATGSAGAVGKTSRHDDSSDPDAHRERRHRKHRHREKLENEDDPVVADPRHERIPSIPVDERGATDGRHAVSRPEDSANESVDDGRGKRKHHRRKHRDKTDPTRELDPDEAVAAAGVRPARVDEDPNGEDAFYRRDERAIQRGSIADPDAPEERTLSPGDGEDDRPRRVQLVEPVKEKDDNRPRGILKPTRQVPFPEDPNPTREGVAPLKDAGKQGVPSGARWTKISRVLVNPEALEKAHERFEERDDYVIVLRVVSKEEIQKFAEKTREIRDAREREWQEELESRRRRRSEKHRSRDEKGLEDDDGDNEEPTEPLAIDQRPAVPGLDPRALTGRDDGLRNTPGALPIPDIRLDAANYSTNV